MLFTVELLFSFISWLSEHFILERKLVCNFKRF